MSLSGLVDLVLRGFLERRHSDSLGDCVVGGRNGFLQQATYWYCPLIGLGLLIRKASTSTRSWILDWISTANTKPSYGTSTMD
jgi:hypothetical protein